MQFSKEGKEFPHSLGLGSCSLIFQKKLHLLSRDLG